MGQVAWIPGRNSAPCGIYPRQLGHTEEPEQVHGKERRGGLEGEDRGLAEDDDEELIATATCNVLDQSARSGICRG